VVPRATRTASIEVSINFFIVVSIRTYCMKIKSRAKLYDFPINGDLRKI